MPLTYMNMKKIVLSFFALAALNCSAQSVSQRLERLFDADQQIRKTETVDSLIEAQDSVNRAVLKEFIADYNPDSCSVKANQGLSACRWLTSSNKHGRKNAWMLSIMPPSKTAYDTISSNRKSMVHNSWR